MTPLERYHDLCRQRSAIISENRSRRMRVVKQPPLPVPPKPERPLVPVCYEPDGTYHGVLADASDCPAGHSVRWEPAMR